MMHRQEPTDFGELLAYLRVSSDLQDAPFMTFYQDGERVVQYTYSAFLKEVDRRAAWLAEMGIDRGDRVALLSPNRAEVPMFVLALMRIGAAVIPLNPISSASEWEFIVNHAGVRGLLATSRLLASCASIDARLEFRQDIAHLPDVAASAIPAPSAMRDDVATILYTSGTTARPKGVAMSHWNILVAARAMAHNFALSRTTHLTTLPLFHAHGFQFGFMTTVVSHGHLVFTDRFDPFVWTDLIRRENVTMTSAFPTMLPLLIRAKVRRSDVPQLRCMMVTSAPLAKNVAVTFEEEVGIPIMHAWGLSESTALACSLHPEQPSTAHRRLLCDWDVPSVGAALRGIEMAVLDPNGNPVAPQVKGELCVRGDTVMQGYYRDPDATALAIRDGWLRSGDEGFYVLDEGTPFFFVTGRIKEIIIRGGENFSPVALEDMVLQRVPQFVGSFVFLGYEHALFGEEIGVYVEDPGHSDALATAFQDALDSMPFEVRPKVIVYGAAAIPRTHSGKVQRRKLQPYFQPYREHVGAPVVVRHPDSARAATGP